MSSLVYLGISLITFVSVFGVAFILTPMILGSVFTTMDSVNSSSSAEWSNMYEQNKETAQYLVPLMPSFGIVIIVIKLLLTSSARGRE